MTAHKVGFSTPGIGATSYWEPAHRVQSAWREHAPFGYWLVEALRPRSIVELGTHNGYSFFVFAEAVRRLGLACHLSAIDSWEGDDQTGFYGQEVYQSVAVMAQEFYPESTELIRSYFGDAVSKFEDGSVDLLHIDGRHRYEDVQQDFETYRPKLSSRSVVLFHDTHEVQPSFGVHRFWGELASSAPSFEFHHGHGLGVLAFGPDVPQEVLAFIEHGHTAPDELRNFYSARGSLISQSADLAELGSARELEVANLKCELIKYNNALIFSQGELAATRDRVDGIIASTSWKFTAPLRAVTEAMKRPR